MEMIIDEFGNQETELYTMEGMEEFLICTFNYDNNKYIGLMDEDFRILIPFSTVPIKDYIFTMDRNNYCFCRNIVGENNYESYHFSKNTEDNLFYLKNYFQSTATTSVRVTNTVPPKNNYWFVETTTNAGITELSLYDIKKGKIITPAFSLISFEQEKSRVLAYVEKDIYSEIDDEIVKLTSLSAFIDKEGHFLTPLYNIEKDEHYDTLGYNFDSTFQSFERMIEKLRVKLTAEFIEKQKYIEDILNQMYTNIYTEEEMNASKCKTKILKFSKEV